MLCVLWVLSGGRDTRPAACLNDRRKGDNMEPDTLKELAVWYERERQELHERIVAMPVDTSQQRMEKMLANRDGLKDLGRRHGAHRVSIRKRLGL